LEVYVELLGVSGFGIAAAVVVLIGLYKSVIVVKQKTAVIIERLGKLHAVKHAGPRLKIPFIDRIAERMELWLMQLDIEVDTKTKDNVFLDLSLAVQYRVDDTSDETIADAYYKLDDVEEQVTAFVSNMVRAILPTLNLDAAFEDVNSIAERVKSELDDRMRQYGFIIEAVLVTEIKPDEKVVAAMNNINAAQRDRVAAEQRGEADRILAVKRGEGVGGERLAIVSAYAESIRLLAGVEGVNSDEASRLLAMTMHYDALRAAAAGPATTILLPTDGNSAVEKLLAGTYAGNVAGESAPASSK
jgi:regulator of protease activity HflC (stomatin/prohibitin superfamily)